MKHNYVVIMAGGIGTRFWPLSRSVLPKQFQDFLRTGKTLLQQTADRFNKICPKENLYIVTNQSYLGLVKDQLPWLKDDQILLEPVGRNTAPCIAYACYKISTIDEQANLVVSPADHVILNEKKFTSTIQSALAQTKNKDILVTIGIKPDRPDTGYGYIQYLEDDDSTKSGPATSTSFKKMKKVKTFTEKPHLQLAKRFLESGEFVWNAGIFLWNVNSIIKAFGEYLPEIAEIFEGGLSDYFTPDEFDFILSAYSHCRNVSIDYGIMEKASNVYVALSDFGWSDIGTWKSLFNIVKKDNHNNVIDGNILIYDSSNCIIKTPKNKLLIVEGLDDYIIVEHDDVMMICKKESEQRVKEFVADVKMKKGEQFI